MESKSFTAEEALENGLIDLIAADVDELLAELDGREVEAGRREPVTLRTADAEVAQPRDVARSSASCRPSPTPTSPTS